MKKQITISELNNRKAHTSKNDQVKQTVFHVEHLTRHQIEQNFRLFGSIIPSYSEDANHRRTAYFFRKAAIAWAREARQPEWRAILNRPACIRLAKAYLAHYREMKGANLN